MHRRTLAILTALAVGGMVLAGTVPATAADEPPSGAAYVAIGDSIAAGTGNQPYVDRDCLRSAKAYPMVLARQLGGVASSACAGASTDAILALQLGDLGDATRLVTITAGINNFDWQGVLLACSQDANAPACQQAFAAATPKIAALPQDIGTLVTAVRMQAPMAQIVVTGYPMLFGDVTTSCSVGAFRGTPVKFAASQTVMVNQSLALVNQLLATGVAGYVGATSDPGVEFVDVTGAFEGHGLCDTGDRWISGLVNGPVMFDRSFHPNTPGQQAYATAIAAALAG